MSDHHIPPLTREEAEELLRADEAFCEAGGLRSTELWFKGFP